MTNQPYIIPAIVAIVAIAGLVMNFQGGAVGLFHDAPQTDFPTVTQDDYYAYGARSQDAVLGIQVAPEAAVRAREKSWEFQNNAYSWCGPSCTEVCKENGAEPYQVGINTAESECPQFCTTVCHDIILEEEMLLFK